MSQAAHTVKETSTETWTSESWARVCNAVQKRWPHISEGELKDLPCKVDSMVSFLKEFTDTSLDEIKSVVMEFAPEGGFTERFSAIAENVTEPIHSAYERARYEADEHPMTTSGVVFVAGLALGILGTVAYYRSRQEPSRVSLYDYLPDRWAR
ncbi:hypothetical protein [Neorhodopirellula pilleata]|uniref:Uncharacterized protein n=1 Tax=Neorhodopirellula pilleata TaxID=2714738 RepID=A0A5C5ZVB2_9BACT|nr:hypothetical protein [Neorhodopirellula pilleata]TWT91180.1 hypothetical protein Pla100_53540 [Neorhodopirellula pilleata]